MRHCVSNSNSNARTVLTVLKFPLLLAPKHNYTDTARAFIITTIKNTTHSTVWRHLHIDQTTERTNTPARCSRYLYYVVHDYTSNSNFAAEKMVICPRFCASLIPRPVLPLHLEWTIFTRFSVFRHTLDCACVDIEHIADHVAICRGIYKHTRALKNARKIRFRPNLQPIFVTVTRTKFVWIEWNVQLWVVLVKFISSIDLLAQNHTVRTEIRSLAIFCILTDSALLSVVGRSTTPISQINSNQMHTHECDGQNFCRVDCSFHKSKNRGADTTHSTAHTKP